MSRSRVPEFTTQLSTLFPRHPDCGVTVSLLFSENSAGFLFVLCSRRRRVTFFWGVSPPLVPLPTLFPVPRFGDTKGLFPPFPGPFPKTLYHRKGVRRKRFFRDHHFPLLYVQFLAARSPFSRCEFLGGGYSTERVKNVSKKFVLPPSKSDFLKEENKLCFELTILFFKIWTSVVWHRLTLLLASCVTRF